MTHHPSRRSLMAGAGALALASCARAGAAERTNVLPRARRIRRALAAPMRGINTHQHSNEAAFDHARGAGFSFLRADIFWHQLERGGQYDFAIYDRFAELMAARGLGVLYVLAYGHPDHPNLDGDDPEALTHFNAYAGAVVARYRGRGYDYEIWNEPDVEEKAFLPPARFADMVVSTAATVRGADPDAKIICGGLSWVDFAYLDPMLARFGRRRPNVDAVGMHFYRSTRPETAIDDIALLRARLRPVFGDKPLWNTEWGYSSAQLPDLGQGLDGHAEDNRQRQAALLSRQFLVAWQTGLERTVWYELQDRSGDARHGDSNLGLLAGERPKPAYYAARTFDEVARGRRLIGTYDGMPGGVRGLKLRGGDDVVAVLWCETFGARQTIRVPGFVSARSMLGAPVRPAGLTDGAAELVLAEADGPVFVTLAR